MYVCICIYTHIFLYIFMTSLLLFAFHYDQLLNWLYFLPLIKFGNTFILSDTYLFIENYIDYLLPLLKYGQTFVILSFYTSLFVANFNLLIPYFIHVYIDYIFHEFFFYQSMYIFSFLNFL